MNIAIVGPPGAKKSRLAKKMKDTLDDCLIVDNYVNKLQRDTNLALGRWATWSENYMIAGYRRAAELKARVAPLGHVITVGTILDTMYYCGLASQSEILARGESDPYGTQLATTAAMSGVGLWFRSDWDYDLTFVMERNKGDDWIVQYSEDIKPLAQSLSIPGLFRYESLEQFDEHIFAQIVEAASNDGSGVRSGGGPSEESGEAPIDVPDVRG